MDCSNKSGVNTLDPRYNNGKRLGRKRRGNNGDKYEGAAKDAVCPSVHTNSTAIQWHGTLYVTYDCGSGPEVAAARRVAVREAPCPSGRPAARGGGARHGCAGRNSCEDREEKGVTSLHTHTLPPLRPAVLFQLSAFFPARSCLWVGGHCPVTRRVEDYILAAGWRTRSREALKPPLPSSLTGLDCVAGHAWLSCCLREPHSTEGPPSQPPRLHDL